ncbi:MAG: GlsB/YeaQ/YmgE family stress response membrane protein [Oscillospiraceae bacterium]|nr:GlsB/YeaQ/YmgE family stress response membrane protein [Oscillospiraceae bacterium]
MLISLLLWVLFGALVGWLAGILMKSKNSLIVNIIIGIVGSMLGGFIASFIGIGSLGSEFSFDIWNILISVGGACVVIFLCRVLKIGK